MSLANFYKTINMNRLFLSKKNRTIFPSLFGILLTAVLTTGGSWKAVGQNQRYEAGRIAFLTEELNLTEQQAQAFWPIFNQYQLKRKSITKDLRQVRRALETGTLGEEEATKQVTASFQFRQQQLELDKEYFPKFGKVLKPGQLAKLSVLDRVIARMLLRNKRGGGGANKAQPDNPGEQEGNLDLD
jgi:Spy/CpxP family protein refolding chaperone